ncbi:MAG: hypothetical protein WCK35_13635 [Chloroflexota bacterium]
MTISRKMLILLFGILLVFFCIVAGLGLLIFNRSFANSRPTAPPLIFPTRSPTEVSNLVPGVVPLHETPTVPSKSGPMGKIAFVCQIFKTQAQDQICIINADGSGWRRLTENDKVRSFYPSITPDGNSVVFSSNSAGNFKLFEISLVGLVSPLGDTVGYAPEVSPDNKLVVFTNSDGQKEMIWVMDRVGSNLRLLYSDAWDPTWSPDGTRVLFATHIDDQPQLASIKLDGTDFKAITNIPELRGRSDWSADGMHIVTYAGKSWARELYMLNADGSNLHQITPPGGNSQGPSFSPDGQWVAFTAYYDSIGKNNGCEIYIMKITGDNLKRLTNNAYCDWQPRWGP